MWSVSLKHYKCKEDSSGSYIIHDGRLRAGYARVVTRQGVEWRKMTKNTWQYFEDEADYRLLLVSMQVSIIILILRAESPIIEKSWCTVGEEEALLIWGCHATTCLPTTNQQTRCFKTPSKVSIPAMDLVQVIACCLCNSLNTLGTLICFYLPEHLFTYICKWLSVWLMIHHSERSMWQCAHLVR